MGYKSKFKGSTVDERLRKCLNLVSTTYQSLLDLRENSSLVPGRFYRITDYVTTTSQENTQSAGHQFDVIVLALTNDTLSERAWACHHEGDTYFQNSHLESWQIWYCLDNDASRFEWATPASSGGKGVIYRMIDEWGNDVPYDFKNILFKHPNNITTYSDYYYTFTVIFSGVVNDKSLEENYCYGNTMSRYVVLNRQRVNGNVFINRTGDFCSSNTFGDNCSSNTFESNCNGNTFGDNCSSNTFESNCNGNTFVSFCINNKVYTGVSVTLVSTQAGSFNALIQNYQFTNGLKSEVAIRVERNRQYQTTIAVNSAGRVEQFCIADLVQ